MGGTPNLDPASRRTLRWLGLRLAVVAAASGTVAAFAAAPLARFLVLFQVLCFWGAVMAAAFALSVGEAPRRGVLGFWDEALVLGGLALLANAARRLLVP